MRPRMIRQVPEEELRSFFGELRDFYLKEKHDFVWEWDKVATGEKSTDDFVYFIAFNLSKNILHGPLPSNLHARMIFNKNPWSQRYFDYLEGK